MLIKLIYASQATRTMSDQDLKQLLIESRRRNVRLDISGMLLYARQSFLQIIEGEAAAVDAVYSSILRDTRHHNVRLLTREPIRERRYRSWSMGFEIADDESLGEALPGFIPPVEYPLVSGDLVRNGTVAETLLGLYARNG